MINDRVFFGNAPLAFVKAGICLIAFLTTLFFIKDDSKVYLFGVITYSCGCICDYIEVTSMRNKSKCVRCFALLLSIVLGACIAVAFSMAAMYDANQEIQTFIDTYNIGINYLLASFFAIPLANGILLSCKMIQQDEEKKHRQSNKRSVSAFDVKP